LPRQSKWVGVDWDGTLVKTVPHKDDAGTSGAFIRPICELVEEILEAGTEVRVFTARVSPSNSPADVAVARDAIEEKFEERFGVKPKVTCEKDADCLAIIDNIAVCVLAERGAISDLNGLIDEY
jgi:hypothetical protein